MNDEYVENITMPDGSVWLQLGVIRKYNPHPNSDPEKEVRKDRRIFIKLDEIVSVGSGEERVKGSHGEDDTRAAVVLSGGETINVETYITETMEIIQEAVEQNNRGLLSLCSNCRKVYEKNPKTKGTK